MSDDKEPQNDTPVGDEVESPTGAETANDNEEPKPVLEENWEELIQEGRKDAAATAEEEDILDEVASADAPVEKPKRSNETFGAVDPVTNMAIDDLTTRVEEFLYSKSPEERERVKNLMIERPDEYFAKLLRMVYQEHPAYTSQADFGTDGLKALREIKATLETTVNMQTADKVSYGSKKHSNELHGQNAALAFTSKLKGVRKINFYNSGFHVVIRPFSLAELNEFFISVDRESQELGRQLGAHFYLMHDLYIKMKFMELFPLCVVSSNLENWKRGKTLERALKIHEFDRMYWGVLSLMHKKGVTMPLVCSDDNCKHARLSIKCDVDRMCLVNTSAIPEAALEWLAKGDKVTLKQVQEEYQKKLLGFEEQFMYRDVRITTKVPSIHDTFEYGKNLMATITANMHGEKTLLNKHIAQRVAINYSRCFVPWTSKVEQMDEDHKNVIHWSTDLEALHTVLDPDPNDPMDESLTDGYHKFMHKSKLAYCVYAPAKCECCGKEDATAIEGYKAWDAQYLFFSLTYRMLEPMGIV